MALTNGFLAICIAIGLLYLFLYKSPVRLHRMIGCLMIPLVSIYLATVEDTLAMYSFFLVNFAICMIKFTEDVGNVLGIFGKKKNGQ